MVKMATKLKRKDANFEFTIHRNHKSGPSRTFFEPTKAHNYFSNFCKKEKDGIIRAKHLDSKLSWETDNPSTFDYFAKNVVVTVGVKKNG